jgi:hypothetical protein
MLEPRPNHSPHNAALPQENRNANHRVAPIDEPREIYIDIDKTRGSAGGMPRTVDALGDLQQPVRRLAVEELAEQRHPASGARSVRRARNATL